MPLIDSVFSAPRFFRHGHLQTILPLVLPRRRAGWQTRERLELADGDFVDLDWQQSGRPRLVILAHGLEGSARAIYMRGMARTFEMAGWDVLGWNYRGCSGVPNRLPRSYHSGESADLRAVVVHAAKRYESIALVGFSLGGNIVLKYLGEQPPHLAVRAAVAISSPVDLASSAAALDNRRGNWIYQRRFLNTLLGKIAAKACQFPDHIDATDLRRIGTIREFDERFTAPLHGFAGADDYWARASALPHLNRIAVPALLLNARNDPLLDLPSFPQREAAANPCLYLETPHHGGHVGFLDFTLNVRPWHERRTLEFLNETVGVLL